jgi:hypothetical protein
MKLKIKPFFRWYDLWIGLYIDWSNKTVYICPIPMLGLKIDWRKPPSSKGAPPTDRDWENHYSETDRVRHYRLLEINLGILQHLNNGKESEDENRILDKIDSVWRQMTEEEREIIN